jgi:hypothetical protein
MGRTNGTVYKPGLHESRDPMRLRKKTMPSPVSTLASAHAHARSSAESVTPKEPDTVRQGLSAADLIAMARSARRQATQV